MKKLDISVFFPVYNEEKNIRKVIGSMKKILESVANKYEIIAVYFAGSTDNSLNLLKEMAKNDKHLRIVHQKVEEKGYGHALRIGFGAARYEHIFYSDSDDQFDLRELKTFLPFVPYYDLIIGYRKKRMDPFMRLAAATIFNFLIKIMLHVNVRDPDCAFKFCRKKIFDKVTITCRRSADVELISKAKKYGFKIKEIPVTHYKRRWGLGDASLSSKIHIVRPEIIVDTIHELLYLRKVLK